MTEPAAQSSPVDDAAATAAAQSFVGANLTIDTSPLAEALRAVYGDGYALGALSGTEQTSATMVAGLTGVDVPVSWSAFWDGWEPGNLDAAVLLDDGGFAQLLDQADITVQGISATTLDRLGSLLAEGALNGDSVDTIARTLGDYLDDPQRAYTLANTELARAVTAASLNAYAAAEIEEWDLITSPDACPECVAIEAANPHPVTDAEGVPPVHPNCRCAASPAV